MGGAACGWRTSPDHTATGAGTGASSAFRVYRDPTTGAFVEPPPGAAMPATPRAPAAMPPSALVEEAAPGGGRMVRLRGNFRSHVVARADASGTAVSCTTTARP
jgi:hypothetical protein